MTGNSQYVSLGGEFPKVNNVAQQGLVRMAVRPLAPNLEGPRYQSDFTPQLSTTATGAVRVRFRTTWDPETRDLQYRVVRDGQTVPVPVTLGRFPLRQFVVGSWPSLLLVGCMLAVGLGVFRRRPGDPAARDLLLLGGLVTCGAVGWLLGGSVGVGTVVYALAIGPLVHVLLPRFMVPAAEPKAASKPAPANC